MTRGHDIAANAGSVDAASARAWLLDIGHGRRVAVGERELHEVIADPELTADPAAPAHRRARLAWRGRLLPVTDLAVVFSGDAETAPARWVTVASYLDEDSGDVAFAALRLSAPPASVRVNDTMACPLPEDSLRDYLVWRYIGLSCFRHDGRPVPIIDLGRLFALRAQARFARLGAARGASDSRGPERLEALS